MIKPLETVDKKEITYSDKDWKRFEDFRRGAKKILEALQEFNIKGFAHGSIARGDVKKSSDIDIATLQRFPSYKLELALKRSGFRILDRKIVMATPWQLPKAHISLGDERIVTFPLKKPKKLEEEFYKFGGIVDLNQIKEKERVPGVDKRLVLIEPTKEGRKESQVIGRESEVAKKIGASIEIVEERIEVLTRRNNIGRTGVFLQRELAPDESFEAVLKQIADKNPEVRRRFRED